MAKKRAVRVANTRGIPASQGLRDAPVKSPHSGAIRFNDVGGWAMIFCATLAACFPALNNNLGIALAQVPGRLPEAIAEYQSALRIRPDYAVEHYNLGNALAQMPGRLPDAIAEYQAALRVRPDFAEAHNNLGNALAAMPGRLPEAIAEYQTALWIRPGYAEARDNLGNAMAHIKTPASR
jgi:tetratricopeptide (TPR) repeat protein